MNVKLKFIITAALIVLFGSDILEAYSKTPVKRKTRRELIIENDSLRTAIDSLTVWLGELAEMTRTNDSIADVIFSQYEEEIGDDLIIRDSTATVWISFPTRWRKWQKPASAA